MTTAPICFVVWVGAAVATPLRPICNFPGSSGVTIAQRERQQHAEKSSEGQNL
jgi:hypothetical protein